MTSRLVIGTPRFKAKPPRRVPCFEPLIYGPNILRDASFEAAGGGPGGNEIPKSDGLLGTSGLGKMLWSDSSEAPTSSGWVQEISAGDGGSWIASTASPNAGSKHGRWVKPTPSVNLTPDLYCVGLVACDHPNGATGRGTPYSARVAPGDLVTFRVRMRFAGTATSPSARVTLAWIEVDGTPAGAAAAGSFISLSGSYTVVSHTAAATSTAYYLRAFVATSFGGISSSTATFDADSCELEVID